jgi:hypothetical protein
MVHEEWMLRVQILMGRLASRISEPSTVDGEMSADIRALETLCHYWAEWTQAQFKNECLAVLEAAEKAGVNF